MNSVFLSNLTNAEFLKQIQPTTELERMFADRLELHRVDAAQVAELEQELRDVERELSAAQRELEDAEIELESVKEYAERLLKFVREKEPESELLEDAGILE